jgi:hypothetical protein
MRKNTYREMSRSLFQKLKKSNVKVLFAVLSLGLLIFLAYTSGNSTEQVGFRSLAYKHGTDKATHASYGIVYDMYLGGRRLEKLRLLEIGLGCDMNYPPGASLTLWREYLPNAAIDFLEFNRPCAEKFEKRVENLFIGDQTDSRLLGEIASRHQYDAIVDDGGHTRRMHILTLIGLWSSLKPRGIYVIEDISTALWTDPHYNDFNVSTIEVLGQLIVLFGDSAAQFKLKSLSASLSQLHKDLLAVNCLFNICALVKK